MSSDSKDTQPFRHRPEDDHREYIPATWAAPGHGGGHPKLSGGEEVDRKTGRPAPRPLNRADQRYSIPASEATSRREARAATEEPSCVILQGESGLIDLRSPSGNNYDLLHDATGCDCPDQWRLDESYGPGVFCKHHYIVETRLTSVGGYSNLPWSTARLAEVLGIDVRTAERLCQLGAVPATKTHNVWVVDIGPTLDSDVAAYLGKIIGSLPDLSGIIRYDPER